jgi:thiosulfate/3-mercaptopyruvate sulfurtransferase
LINAEQVDSFRKNQKNLVILDATWHGENSEKARAEFQAKHLPGARFLDLNHFNDPESALPSTLNLDEAVLSEALSALGLRPDCKIILYDNSDYHSACRALWMLKVCGHPPQLLYILDGGLKAWQAFGGKVETGETSHAVKAYSVKLQTKYLRTLEGMKANLRLSSEQVLDARHAIRFTGGPEPRPHLRPGHMPGSFCFPFQGLFDSSGLFLPLEKLKRRLEGIGLSLTHPTITTCGSGMTAPILNFVLDILGNDKTALYDGSWTEWGAEELFPGEQSLAERPVETCL